MLATEEEGKLKDDENYEECKLNEHSQTAMIRSECRSICKQLDRLDDKFLSMLPNISKGQKDEFDMTTIWLRKTIHSEATSKGDIVRMRQAIINKNKKHEKDMEELIEELRKQTKAMSEAKNSNKFY